MKTKLKTALLGVVLSYGLVFAQGESSQNPIYDFFGVYNGSMKFLNFYVEYATGDLSSLGKDSKAKRNGENFDTKLTYRQTLKKAPWLGFGFVLQTVFDQPSAYDPNWKEGSRSNKNTSNPFSSVSLSANATLLNTFSFSFSSSGDFQFSLFLNKRLPQVSVFRSHTITFMFQQDIFIRGNQYVNNTLTQGWYDGTEFRIAYQMRINEWFAFRPELQFKILAGAQTKFSDSYWIRFNPRLQFFLEEWTFFIEPRLFYGGIWKKDLRPLGIGYSQFNKDGWAIELKVGIDLTKLFFD